MARSQWLFVVAGILALGGDGHAELQVGGDISEVIYQWVALDEHSYDFSTEGGDAAYKEWVESGNFSAEHAIIHGIKIYEGEILVSVPRLGPGVPSTLNKIVHVDGKALLRPYPSWAWQELRDCSAFQTVQSFEVDPIKGWLWVIDSGRIQTFYGGLQNVCPPKIVIYNMKTGETVRHYEFPDDVVRHTGNFLSDITVDNRLDIAYISNLGEGALAMYSFRLNKSVRFFDRTTYPTNITPVKVHEDYINLADSSAGVDSVALSPDGNILYYGHLAEPVFYQVNTSFMHSCFENPKWAKNIAMFSHKIHQRSSDGHTRGRVMGQRSMFYGGIGSNSVYRWDWFQDAYNKSNWFDARVYHLRTLVRDSERILWVESLGIDGKSGYLWFTSINLAKYFLRKMDISGKSGPNMYIWRVFVNEGSYNLPYQPTTTPPYQPTTTPPRQQNPRDRYKVAIDISNTAQRSGDQAMVLSPTLLLLVLLQGLAISLTAALSV